MKVLVVDDDVVSRMVLMHLVDSCGSFEIVEAEDGADAWRQLEEGLSPAICFCDLRMPHLSGMELLQRVRAEPAFDVMPFVLVTSANDDDTVQMASKAGAAGFIVKPFQAEQVRQHLDGLLKPGEDGAQQRPRGHGHGQERGQEGGQEPAVAHEAEAPAATLQRLGINHERLLAYLSGFHKQLDAAGGDIAALLARGEQREALVRLERLRTGCATLGLGGAAAALADLAATGANAALNSAAVQAALAGVVRAVLRQSGLVRQTGAA
ncbi:response regulator [Rugamonas sp. CCM 8940]|uniref:response regulator n=1 Tax=Rugamonas sp. CCM 8940 TaxID=2765359 RepID=UPI0018F46B97|nr:response regulator [Rugamonas sp. CCM 8940]MBJ7308705.1 response regulator [Rugamonas sp. CCM 8940]